jgi:hypothetical protein
MNGLKFDRAKTMLDGYTKTKTEYADNCKTPLKKPKGLDLGEWIERVRKYWLTIDDVKKLKSNEQVEVVCLDRNIYDSLDGLPKNTLMRPEKSFENRGADCGFVAHSAGSVKCHPAALRPMWRESTA